MKIQLLSIIFTSCAMAMNPIHIFAQNTEQRPRFVPGEVIVKMKPSQSPEAMTRSILGVEEAPRVTSGGEIILRITPSRSDVMMTLYGPDSQHKPNRPRSGQC